MQVRSRHHLCMCIYIYIHNIHTHDICIGLSVAFFYDRGATSCFGACRSALETAPGAAVRSIIIIFIVIIVIIIIIILIIKRRIIFNIANSHKLQQWS